MGVALILAALWLSFCAGVRAGRNVQRLHGVLDEHAVDDLARGMFTGCAVLLAFAFSLVAGVAFLVNP